MPGGLVVLGMLVWSASFLKVIAMACQLRALIKSRSTKGASLGMLSIFCYVQAAYACSSYQAGQWAIFWGMLFTLIFTAASTGFVIYLRHGAAISLIISSGKLWRYRGRWPTASG